MNPVLKKLGQVLYRFSPQQNRKQVQVMQMVRRWVTEEEKRQKPRLRKSHIRKTTFGDSGYVLLILPATAFGLGTWQVQRRKWKLGLIDQLESRTTAEPIEIPEDYQELLAEDMQYRRVRVRGTFDHSKEIYLGPRSNVNTESGSGMMSYDVQTGFNVITPLKVTGRNLTVMVNRGWVPVKKKKPHTRKAGQVEGEVELVGIIRHSEKRAPFTPKDKDKPDIWLRRDAEKMAEITGADPILIDADKNSTVPEGPIGGQTRVSLRNEHVSYIITWYSLAFFMTYIWYRRYRQPPPPDKAAFLARRPGGPLD